MKNVRFLAIVATAVFFSCHQISNRQLDDARVSVKDAKRIQSDSVKAKKIADWKQFKTESDHKMAKLDNDITSFHNSSVKQKNNGWQKRNSLFLKARTDIKKLRDKLNKKSIDFDHNMQTFNDIVAQQNEIFIREFVNDLEQLNQSVNKLFTDPGK